MTQAHLKPVIDPLEQQIDHQAMLLHFAQTPAERRAAWDELCRLVAQRSPQRVAQMEREAGLSHG